VTRRGRWWTVAAVVVCVALAAVLILATRRHTSSGTGSSASSATAGSAAADCRPRVADVGFGSRAVKFNGQQVAPADADITLGVIVQNPCPRAAVNVQLLARATTASGSDVAGALHLRTSLDAVMPGQRLGVAGSIVNDPNSAATVGHFNATTVAAGRVDVLHWDWQAATDVAQPTATTAQDVAVGQRQPDGDVPVSFRLGPDAPAPSGDRWVCVLLRDTTDRIVSGEMREVHIPADLPASGGTLTATARAPGTGAGLHAEIYFYYRQTSF